MYIKNPNFICEEIDNLVMLFDFENEISYDLNEIGSDIWKLISNKSLDEIIDLLLLKYDVDRETLARDVNLYVSNAVNLGMIIVE